MTDYDQLPQRTQHDYKDNNNYIHTVGAKRTRTITTTKSTSTNMAFTTTSLQPCPTPATPTPLPHRIHHHNITTTITNTMSAPLPTPLRTTTCASSRTIGTKQHRICILLFACEEWHDITASLQTHFDNKGDAEARDQHIHSKVATMSCECVLTG